MFFVTTRTDSGIDLPDLNVTDEKILGKYGSDLTANFADIRAYGSKAFFQKKNTSTGSNYSLCACATGYIWVSVSVPRAATEPFNQYSDVEVQIGTFALKARAITTAEIPCKLSGPDVSGPDDLCRWCRYTHRVSESSCHELNTRLARTCIEDHGGPLDGQLALLCSTVLAKYLRLRMIGQQFEEAAETAIRESRKELSAFRIVDPGLFGNFEMLLRDVCTNAPMPPTSDVSLISRSMITRRWQLWRETSILRKRYFFPQRIIKCFQTSRHDSIDLISNCFEVLRPQKSKVSILRT